MEQLGTTSQSAKALTHRYPLAGALALGFLVAVSGHAQDYDVSRGPLRLRDMMAPAIRALGFTLASRRR